MNQQIKKIIGWYNESIDHFLCENCFPRIENLDKEGYKSKTEDDLIKDVYTCDACKKEIGIDKRNVNDNDGNVKENKKLKKQLEIQEEEKLRAEARTKAEDELKKKKKKKENMTPGQGCLVILVIIIFVVIFIILSGGNGEKPALTKAEQRVEMIEEQFSVWDGSHRELTKFIKESMNDPSSYEHVKTAYEDREDYLIVETTFRGKNAFGGIVKNTVRAKVSLDGKIIEITDVQGGY